MFNQEEINTLKLHSHYCKRGTQGGSMDTGGIEIQAIYAIYKKHYGNCMLTCAPCVIDMIKTLYNAMDKQLAHQALIKDILTEPISTSSTQGLEIKFKFDSLSTGNYVKEQSRKVSQRKRK